MKQEHPSKKKVRLSVDCTEQERMYIKMLATKKHMTISEYLLSFAREEMPKHGKYQCKHDHEPNEETAQVLRETDKGENLIEHETLDDFWDALGFGQHA
jgi:hypothetical protein